MPGGAARGRPSGPRGALAMPGGGCRGGGGAKTALAAAAGSRPAAATSAAASAAAACNRRALALVPLPRRKGRGARVVWAAAVLACRPRLEESSVRPRSSYCIAREAPRATAAVYTFSTGSLLLPPLPP